MAPRHDFLNQPAPENYVAGLGRGATGFTTRSDLGPARSGPSEEQIKEALAKRAAQIGNDGTFAGEKKETENNDDDERFQDPENEVGLFASGAFDRDDDEADRIYQAVDERMEKRRKQQREDRERMEREDFERQNPKIQQQFADLKRPLATLTDDDWAAIPDVGDLTGKNKRVKRDNQSQRRFYAVPDSVLAGASAQGQFETSIDSGEAQPTEQNGNAADGTQTNFADIGRARDKVLQVHLDQAAMGATTDANSGTATNIDHKGYLTNLANSTDFSGEAQVGDIKRVRALLENVIKTNPKHAPGWIAAARIEQHAGKVVAARNVIARGCEFCPKSEDAWLENINLNDAHNGKIIAAAALKENNQSVRLWTTAMNLESDTKAKQRVIRQAIDHVPSSVELWKEAVNLEETPSDAKMMLSKATEVLPLSVELWLALARLESAEEAQKILNKARKAVPTSYEIWVAAASLSEQTGDAEGVKKVMRRAMKSLQKESAMLKHENWIEEAEKADAQGNPLVCAAIIHETLSRDVDKSDQEALFMKDAQAAEDRGRIQTARSIYDVTVTNFPSSVTAWTAAADLERRYGKKEALWAVLDRAVEGCPHAEKLWLENVHEKYHGGDIEGARETIGRAFDKTENSETIWLAAIKLEVDAGDVAQARKLLEPGREVVGSDRMWVRSVSLERAEGEIETALDLIADGLTRYPKAAKLYMQKGQIYEFDMSPPQIPQAREAYLAGTRACPKNAIVWVLAAKLEEAQGAVTKARSLLERGRMACPNDPYIWVESVRIERRTGNMSSASTLMARALQAVPPSRSSILWSERIWHLEQRTQRRTLVLEAMKKADQDALLFVTAARIFWGERRLEKAATWFEKALVLDSSVGDTWAWYLKFLKEHGAPEKRQEVTDKCISVEPTRGEAWAGVQKDPKNAHKKTEEILRMVMERLE